MRNQVTIPLELTFACSEGAAEFGRNASKEQIMDVIALRLQWIQLSGVLRDLGEMNGAIVVGTQAQLCREAVEAWFEGRGKREKVKGES